MSNNPEMAYTGASACALSYVLFKGCFYTDNPTQFEVQFHFSLHEICAALNMKSKEVNTVASVSANANATHR